MLNTILENQSGRKAIADPPSIDLVVQALPPTHDAIGEYTANLAETLARQCKVRVLTSVESEANKLKSVEVQHCFGRSGPQRYRGMLEALNQTTADAVLVQYNPFAWGRRGWAWDFVRALRAFKASRKEVTLAVVLHEIYTMDPTWKSMVMRSYQRPQLMYLVDAIDVCFCSTQAWVKKVVFSKRSARVYHAPVGSNLPSSKANREGIRERWGLRPDDLVCGFFGSSHSTKLDSWVIDAVNHLQSSPVDGRRVVLFHVGGSKVDWSAARCGTVVTGRLSPEGAADALSAADLMLSPFRDGVSARRGSVIAALQQGSAVATTRGASTDQLWNRLEGDAVYIASADSNQEWLSTVKRAAEATVQDQRQVSTMARQAYESHFTWQRVADRLLAGLEMPLLQDETGEVWGS